MARLTIGCVQTMVNNIRPKRGDEPCVVQVYDITTKSTPRRDIICMTISDSVNCIRGLTNIAGFRKNDVLSITDYHVRKTNDTYVAIIMAYTVVYNNIEIVLGNPEKLNTDSSSEFSLTNKVLDDTLEDVLKEREISGVVEEPNIRPLKALGLTSSDWVIKVRLSRKGAIRTYFNKNKTETRVITFEIIDKDGTEMPVLAFSEQADKFQKILRAGKCYYISKGTIKPNTDKFKVISELCIFLERNTIVKPAVDDPLIKHKVVIYTPIDKIPDLPKGRIINALGIVETVGGCDVTPIYKKRKITLYDEAEQTATAVLWNEFASMEIVVGSIIGIENAHIDEYQHIKQLNTRRDTWIVKEPRDPRVAALKLMLGQRIVPKSGAKLFHKSDVDLIAEVLNPLEQNTLDSKGKTYCVNGKILGTTFERGFYYIGCKKCRKKMQDNKCPLCQANNGSKTYYSFSLQITDGMESIWLVTFGDVGESILGKTADELIAAGESASAQAFENLRSKVIIHLIQ